MKAKRLVVTMACLLMILGGAVAAEGAAAEGAAAEGAAAEEGQAARNRGDLATGLIALAAAVAIGATAIATGIAQSRIGAAGAGTIAERPESSGTILVLLAIPETMVILGFIVAVIVIFTL
jgi:V/A-type H+-transporting ATPase subunit K